MALGAIAGVVELMKMVIVAVVTPKGGGWRQGDGVEGPAFTADTGDILSMSAKPLICVVHRGEARGREEWGSLWRRWT